uniref:Odorant receptor n=1 Tax=Galleria mellonella TaxID=7137 RepID=A0A5C0E257_GALME|nr:odorant receptor 30 [Galleria mellonella]
MTFMAMGDQELWGFRNCKNSVFKINRVLVLGYAPISLVFQIVFLFANYEKLTFETMGIIFIILPVSILINIELFIAQMKKYKEILKRFFTEVHLYYFKEHDAFTKTVLLRAERYVFLLMCSFVLLVVVDGFLWVIIPVFSNLKNKELILNKKRTFLTGIYLWLPFDYLYNYRNWQIVHTVNVFVMIYSSILLAFGNSIHLCIIFHLIGHIKILKYKIESPKWNELSQEEVKNILVDILKYHAFIKGIKNVLQDVFGLSIGGIYLLNLFVDSLILYQLMMGGTDSVAIYALMVFNLMFELIVISFIIEELRIQTDDISDIIYSIPWEDMSIPNKKTILMMLAQAQTPLMFKAAAGIKTGVQPMIDIFKATFSYYVMLKSTIE